MADRVLLSDPAWFPDRLDWPNRLIRLVRVERAVLATSAFLDGRTPLASASAASRVLTLREFVDGLGERRQDARWLLHESFCGSTLLARILTVDGEALCLREPQVLVDLANWRASPGFADAAGFAAATRAVVAKLAQRWPDGAPIAIKPSNWPNTIAGELLAASLRPRCAIIAITAEAFLVSVLRGGPARLRYVLELYDHFGRARPALARRVVDSLEPGDDGLAVALQHAAGAHWIQRALLDEAGAVAGQAPEALAYPDWIADPPAAARRVAAALALPVSEDALLRSVRHHATAYSKDEGRTHDREAERSDDTRLRALHAEPIGRALGMLERLGKPPL